jgi:glutamate-1-semialdehyde aminotransferase
MGIGTNLLGYGNEEVDKAVANVVSKGNMSTFNCPEEVYLAEKLIDSHPWSDMARFARTGGEANAISIRIGRAASGKDGVAICGYHGWHDWYLALNLERGDGLSNHLLPGLSPKGVPIDLRGSVYGFRYNDFDELLNIVDNNEIGVIMMEVMRDQGPKDGFLEKVRNLATERGIVLIFDECTSGFRQSFGGIHKIFNVDPDMAVFGKAIGNGYALTAILGTRDVMEYAQGTFISSTFWTERIGPTAALKTLEIMEDLKSWEIVTAKGEKIKDRWKKIATDCSLDIKISGIPAICNFSIGQENALKYKTFITQEMLKKGFLSSNLIFVSLAHTDEILDSYFDALHYVFSIISECENGIYSIDDLLDGEVCHSGFKRLT